VRTEAIHPLSRFLLVAYLLEAGLLLVVVPWSAFWDRNFFLESLPILELLKNNFVRGAVSGVGVVSVCAGLVELLALMPRRRRTS
jgi:hypothetical protein